MRTKQIIAMSTAFTIQAVHSINQPVGVQAPDGAEQFSASTHTENQLRWQWLAGLVCLLTGLLVHLPSKAQTFCAPDATAYYTFERTFQDRSTYVDGYTGGTEGVFNTITNRPTFTTTAKVGAEAASFNGTSQYLRYDDASSGYLTGTVYNFSVMFWFKANTPGSGSQTLFEVGAVANGYGVRLTPTGALQARVRTTNGSGTNVFQDVNGPVISDTGWHHVAFTFEGNNATPAQRIKLYLDGTLVGTQPFTETSVGATTDAAGMGATVGQDVWGFGFGTNTAGSFFNGSLDDFVYSIGADVNAVAGVGPNVFTQATITSYLNCLTASSTNVFNCDGGVYISQSQGSTPIELKRFNYTTNNFTNVNTTSGLGYNAIGYNQADNYIYGIRVSTGSGDDAVNRANTLIRIGASGLAEDLGYVINLPTSSTAFVGYNYYIGDVSPAGVYYISFNDYPNTGQSTILYKIDLNTRPYSATATTLSPGTTPLGSDWAYNPTDNLLYTVSDLSGVVRKINPNTGAVTTLTPTNGVIGNSSSAFGAQWFDQYQNLYAYDNFSGTIYRYNLSANTWSTVTTGAPVISQNDAAACPVVKSDPAIAKTLQSQSGNTATFDITLSNNGPAPAADVNARDVLPAGLVFQSAQVLNTSGTALATSAYSMTTPSVGANGTVLLKINNLNVGTGNHVVLRLTVRAAVGACNQTITNCAEISSAFGQTFNNGVLTSPSDNVTAIPGDVASNNEACAPVSFSLTSADPTPVASASALCSGDVFTLSYPNVPAGQSLTWVRMPDSLTGTGDLSQALSNTTTTPMSYTYTAAIQNPYGCSSSAVSTVVTVNPRPTITPSTCSQTICSGQTGNITFTSSVSAVINWVRVEDGATGTGNISQVFTTAGTYTYKIWGVSTAASCPSSTTITCQIVVNNNCCNLDASVATAPSTSCTTPNGSFTITYSGSGNYQYRLNGGTITALGASPAIVSNLTAGSYSLVITDANSATCTATREFVIQGPQLTVYANSNSPVCATNQLTLFATPGGATGTVTYSWTGPDGFSNAAQNPTLPSASTAASGIYTVTARDQAGCTASSSTTVTVATQPSLTITAGTTQTICSGQSTTLTVGGSNGATVTWTNSVGQSGTGTSISTGILQNMGTQPGIITYTFFASAGGTCTDTRSFSLVINPEPVVQVTPSSVVYCNIEQVKLTATAFPNTATINWSRTPATPNPPIATGTGTGTALIEQTLPAGSYTYQFTAKGTNGCTSQPGSVPVTVQQ